MSGAVMLFWPPLTRPERTLLGSGFAGFLGHPELGAWRWRGSHWFETPLCSELVKARTSQPGWSADYRAWLDQAAASEGKTEVWTEITAFFGMDAEAFAPIEAKLRDVAGVTWTDHERPGLSALAARVAHLAAMPVGRGGDA